MKAISETDSSASEQSKAKPIHEPDKKPSKLGLMMANAFGGKKNSIVPSEHENTQIDQSVSETLIQNDDETSPPPEKHVKIESPLEQIQSVFPDEEEKQTELVVPPVQAPT